MQVLTPDPFEARAWRNRTIARLEAVQGVTQPTSEAAMPPESPYADQDGAPPETQATASSPGSRTEPRESAPQRFERIYREVRERICLLHYPPGTVLSESQLAEEFGVSRTPIRRVLQRLSFDGLVDIKNSVGNIVTEIDLKTFKEISDLRMGLADLMGRLCKAEVPQIEIVRARRLLKRAQRLRGSTDYEEYAHISNELAEMLLALIGNQPLREITDILHYRVARTWFSLLPSLQWSEVVETLEQEISQTLDAMERGDIAKVGAVRHYFMGCILAKISAYLTGH